MIKKDIANWTTGSRQVRPMPVVGVVSTQWSTSAAVSTRGSGRTMCETECLGQWTAEVVYAVAHRPWNTSN